MFEKDLKLTYLLDFYGEVLDEHTRSVMKAYYDDDLSLSEVAERVGYASYSGFWRALRAYRGES
jgi:predicted DNA-binding protein YlxM (UPF0122 family)